MTPGERITLITESAQPLAAREWVDIDLTLRNHNMRTSDFAENGPYAYVVEMRDQSGDDDDLQQLHAYLVGDRVDAPTEVTPWRAGRLRLFLSHLAVHAGFVGQVGDRVAGQGVYAFVAHTSIEPSLEWQAVIESALRFCDAMAVFLHPGFHDSLWCDQEVGFALARRVPILPIALGGMPYGFMQKLRAERAETLQPPQLADAIIRWLARRPLAQDAMTAGLVSAFAGSGSYHQTRQLWALLESMPRFSPDQLAALSQAARSNSQVEDANVAGGMVPNLVQQLITRHGGSSAPPATEGPPF